MKKLLIATSFAALAASPLSAQTMTPAAPQSTEVPASTANSQPAQPAPAAAAPTDPKAIIQSEFPTYDKDSSGTLDKTEFAAWIGTLKAKTDTTPTPAAEMTKYTDGAFTTADKDKSKTVTLAELQSYLAPDA
jgi:hypothetical protein